MHVSCFFIAFTCVGGRGHAQSPRSNPKPSSLNPKPSHVCLQVIDGLAYTALRHNLTMIHDPIEPRYNGTSGPNPKSETRMIFGPVELSPKPESRVIYKPLESRYNCTHQDACASLRFREWRLGFTVLVSMLRDPYSAPTHPTITSSVLFSNYHPPSTPCASPSPTDSASA